MNQNRAYLIAAAAFSSVATIDYLGGSALLGNSYVALSTAFMFVTIHRRR